MSGRKPTIFQRLNNIFGPEGINVPKSTTNRYSIGNDALIKTQNKGEYETAKLQAQQNKYIGGMWKKVDGELFQQSIHYETTRIGSYTDFEAMEFYPEISAALDIMMEESTTINDKGRMLNVYSDSKRVKTVLEDLFFNRLDIHTSLPMWTRNTCKYGDNFVFLNIDDKAGVIGVRQLPNLEIERREGDLYNRLLVGRSPSGGADDEDNKTKFYWRGKDVEFNSWQVAHFRLLGDDRRLPYGTSVLEKGRRIWKQLLLSEDAMLIYRITRAPERRVYKIYVGNIDDDDVPAYVDDIANRFKRTPIMDPQTGQIDLKYNQMANDQDFFIPVRSEDAPNPIDTLAGACIALDTKIPLLDGRTLELNEIITEWDNGNRNLWVYSCNPNTGALGAGMISWAGETRKNTEVIKITLDNGESITTTPDHKWVHRTNGFVEAQNLKVGDSLMPFYRDSENIESNTNEYERVWDSSTQDWVFTHTMVADTLDGTGLIKDFTFDNKHIDKKDIEVNYNHKITSIEWLVDKQDTGTITVDGDEIYNNYHTFATESGVFIKNSNLDQIADIEYLQRKLFTALRVPKSFLGFDEAMGDGKNLALQDIRFTRTVNRIQQSMIQELNKVAILHLLLLGLEDELDNFTLTLNNPSTQAEMMKVEHLAAKIGLYKDAVSDAGNGFGVMSMTRGKREILGWADDEIKQDLLEQRLERAASAEMEGTSNVIKHTGMFDTVDRIYGDIEVAKEGGQVSGEESDEGGDAGGGGFGGGGMGDLDFGEGGDEGDIDFDDEGELGDGDSGDLGGDDLGGDDTGELGSTEESFKRVDKLLTEERKRVKTKTKKYRDIYSNKLINSIIPSEKEVMNERVKIQNKNIKINENITNMINDIDKMLDE